MEGHGEFFFTLFAPTIQVFLIIVFLTLFAPIDVSNYNILDFVHPTGFPNYNIFYFVRP